MLSPSVSSSCCLICFLFDEESSTFLCLGVDVSSVAIEMFFGTDSVEDFCGDLPCAA